MASRASARIRSPCRSSARLDFTVRTARSVPSSVPPNRPTDSCAASWDFAMPGSRSAMRMLTTMIAPMVVASSTTSRTAMRIRVPTRATTPLTRLTRLDDAASRRSSVSDVVRVTSSPTGRRVTAGTVARRNFRTSDSRASSTMRSATVPMRIHCASPTADPTTSRPSSSAIGFARLRPPDRESSTHLVTIGVARPIAVATRLRASPSSRVLRCGRAKPMRMRSRSPRGASVSVDRSSGTLMFHIGQPCPSVEHADTFGG